MQGPLLVRQRVHDPLDASPRCASSCARSATPSTRASRSSSTPVAASSASSAGTPKKKPTAPKTALGAVSAPRHAPSPRYMGGQAVLEGVMMRGARTWAVAVRTPDGEIDVDVHDVAGLGRALPRTSRSCAASWASPSRSALGYSALTWSANQQIPEEEQISEKALGWAIVPSRVVLQRDLHRAARVRRQRARQHSVRRLVPGRRGRRAARAVPRLPRSLIGQHQRHPARVPVPRRRAQGDRRVRERRRAHARGGAAVHDRARAVRHQLPAHRDGRSRSSCTRSSGGPNLLVRDRVADRADAGDRGPELRGDPLRGQAHAARAGCGCSMRPGLLLQRLTTREPDLDQLEVAIASLRAVITAEQTAEVDARVGRLVPAVAPAV